MNDAITFLAALATILSFILGILQFAKIRQKSRNSKKISSSNADQSQLEPTIKLYNDIMLNRSLSFLERLAFSLITESTDALPLITGDSTEFINIKAAEVLEPRYKDIGTKIQAGKEGIKNISDKILVGNNCSKDRTVMGDISAELNKILGPLHTQLEKIANENKYLHDALIRLQTDIDEKVRHHSTSISSRHQILENNETKDKKNILRIARSYIENDQEGRAVEILKSQLPKFSDFHEGKTLLVEALFLRNKYQDVLDMVKVDNCLYRSPDARFYFVLALFELEKYEECKDELKIMMVEFPSHPKNAALNNVLKNLQY